MSASTLLEPTFGCTARGIPKRRQRRTRLRRAAGRGVRPGARSRRGGRSGGMGSGGSPHRRARRGRPVRQRPLRHLRLEAGRQRHLPPAVQHAARPGVGALSRLQVWDLLSLEGNSHGEVESVLQRGDQSGEQIERNRGQLRATRSRSTTAESRSSTARTFRLGAGRSQVQILSPRLNLLQISLNSHVGVSRGVHCGVQIAGMARKWSIAGRRPFQRTCDHPVICTPSSTCTPPAAESLAVR